MQWKILNKRVLYKEKLAANSSNLQALPNILFFSHLYLSIKKTSDWITPKGFLNHSTTKY
jgi:hypothetical protein